MHYFPASHERPYGEATNIRTSYCHFSTSGSVLARIPRFTCQHPTLRGVLRLYMACICHVQPEQSRYGFGFIAQ